MTIKLKNGGVWKDLATPYVRQSGSWQTPSEIFVKDAGTWKSVWVDGFTVAIDFLASASTKNASQINYALTTPYPSPFTNSAGLALYPNPNAPPFYTNTPTLAANNAFYVGMSGATPGGIGVFSHFNVALATTVYQGTGANQHPNWRTDHPLKSSFTLEMRNVTTNSVIETWTASDQAASPFSGNNGHYFYYNNQSDTSLPAVAIPGVSSGDRIRLTISA